MESKMVNWVQGMSVSASHFVQTEDYLTEMVYRSLSLGLDNYSYGLLPNPLGAENLSLSLTGTGNHTKVVLSTYYGVTKDGVLVDIENQKECIEASCGSLSPDHSDGWNVVLTISPFERNPCGTPNMEEEPPRYPFVEPTYKLKLMARQRNREDEYGQYSVVVGLLNRKNDTFFLDANYIPPSVTVGSYVNLKMVYERFSSYLKDIRTALFVVLEKSFEQTGRSALVNNITLISQELLRSFSLFHFEWKNTNLSLTPYRLAVLLSYLPAAFRSALSFMSKAEKDEVLNYFKEWIGIDPASFEQMMDGAVTRHYSHTRMGESFHCFEGFLKNVYELFASLSHLEQIGGRKKEEMVIYFSDNQSETVKYKEGWLSR